MDTDKSAGVTLERVQAADARALWEMQKKSFLELLERYQDFTTNPGAESLGKTVRRLAQKETYFYWIIADGQRVGAIRIVDAGGPESVKRVSPLFILPEFRRRGLAQKALALAEERHGGRSWKLDTILEEKGNVRLYEKAGYRKTGEVRRINERMTLVFMHKG